jgi:tetratricopeptide (TPR) repeat protein
MRARGCWVAGLLGCWVVGLLAAVARTCLPHHLPHVAEHRRRHALMPATVACTQAGRALANRCSLLIELGDASAAVKACQLVVAPGGQRAVADPESVHSVAKAALNLGVAQEQLGRLDQAESSYRRASKLLAEVAAAGASADGVLAERARALSNLGHTLLRRGRCVYPPRLLSPSLPPRPHTRSRAGAGGIWACVSRAACR